MTYSTKRAIFSLSLAFAMCLSCSTSNSEQQDGRNSTVAASQSAALSPSAIALPANGENLLHDKALSNVSFWAGDNQGAPVGTYKYPVLDDERFKAVLRVTAENPSGQYYNGSVTFPTIADVKKGDVLLARLSFRSVHSTNESGTSAAVFFAEGPQPHYKKYTVRQVSSNTQWKDYYFPFTVSDDLAAGKLGIKIGFGLGDRAQSFDIGDVSLINYRQSVAITDLPQTKIDYGGSEPDAAWRAQANDRIEALRKGDFRLHFHNQGRPLKNAEVKVEMTRHAYHFGSVVASHWITESGPDADKYRQVVLDNFNQSGTENGLKWPPWIGDWGNHFTQEKTMGALRWLKENNFYTRGHVLVWPSKRNMPRVFELKMPDDKSQADPSLKKDVLNHIDNVATKTAAYTNEWDVLNEPFDNHYLMDAFGNDVMVDWFKRARVNLPGQKLYINDYGILSGGGDNKVHQQHYEGTINFLIKSGAPIDGLGLQSHFDATLTDIPRIYELVDHYHRAFPKLDIRATEFDITIDDEDMQAAYLRDFMTVFFSHPATVGVQIWGFWEKAHWRAEAAMYRANWDPKPSALMWRELVYKQWWSNFSGKSNDKGEFNGRGFYGDYQATVSAAEGPKVFRFALKPGGKTELRFDL